MAKATGDFPAFPGERPTMGQMKEWLESARDQLSADQRALVDGYDPRGLAALEPDSVPPALVASESTGITAPMVATRDVVRMQLQNKNVKLASQKRTLLAELKNEFFQALADMPGMPSVGRHAQRCPALPSVAQRRPATPSIAFSVAQRRPGAQCRADRHQLCRAMLPIAKLGMKDPLANALVVRGP